MKIDGIESYILCQIGNLLQPNDISGLVLNIIKNNMLDICLLDK